MQSNTHTPSRTGKVTRRTLAAGAAWSVPAVIMAAPARAAVVSGQIHDITSRFRGLRSGNGATVRSRYLTALWDGDITVNSADRLHDLGGTHCSHGRLRLVLGHPDWYRRGA